MRNFCQKFPKFELFKQELHLKRTRCLIATNLKKSGTIYTQKVCRRFSINAPKSFIRMFGNTPEIPPQVLHEFVQGFFFDKKGFQKLDYLNYSLWIILNVFTGSSENSYKNLWKCPLTNLMIFFTIFLKNLKKKQSCNFLFPPNISEQFFHNYLKIFSRNFKIFIRTFFTNSYISFRNL